MLSKARANAAKGEYSNVDFRLGEIEHLPVADTSVDVIISNCVINLSPDKAQVFRDGLPRPEGRRSSGDLRHRPDRRTACRNARRRPLYTGCVAGRRRRAESHRDARRRRVHRGPHRPKDASRRIHRSTGRRGAASKTIIASATIEAIKPE
jgi:arsenite methyltransferase